MDGREQIIEESQGLSNYIEDWDGLEENYSTQREAIAVAQMQEELDSKKQDREQRKEYANKIYVLLCSYLIAVFFLLFIVSVGPASLSEGVLIAVVTTTTANIIGIFHFVAKYLFHTKE